ncbi:3-hydroxyacyl-CoA dehydrogenase [Nocardia transvalensis]|uniref:3-hydroxyacyl-CoA dehydrogenase n=1 Tax=Nocardia transvalensis TaxID=37333 RepID=UPI0018958B60|nr:3-hydroxyacyl-CoA dehydrogenase [Nocardia transvalensis]MBF6334105.1 3-hydroxyacyl-CoA dehydrogenase [Nocardia transvalensis]
MAFEIRKVTVLGTGVLGSQIAFQAAFHGFDVTAYDIDEDALTAARDRFAELAAIYRDEVTGAAPGAADKTASSIVLSCDLAHAVADADLVIEAVPEVSAIKQDIFKRLSELAPERAIFATNTGHLLPSELKDFTGRPDKFLALHFANEIRTRNTAEVMGTPETDPAVYRAVVDFAAAIGMEPIELHKEKAGFLLNSMFIPFMNAALGLAVDGYAEPEMIDKTWRIGTRASMGPFQLLDIIGFTTAYNALVSGNEDEQRFAAWLKENYIDQGKLGVATGEGFYRYPANNTTAA